ncbi:SDR family NAD(P)-dependent oxidoreductase [Sphingobium sp.]|uniref:SDR family NAD(P)-dependent oxidoreductase n=1 Tax=Sphingobium TaxID=165695 RepID=UPI001A2F13CF|nr:SDR family NAD(P)-dependent oxidoreductase [Sphingobium sp.]MBJ7375213.1 SDR family oxidoreductase [Sphingobium sp.]
MTAAPIFDLTGRVALVTGASSGLGERFSHILADAGAAVVLAARRTDLLEATRAAIQAKGGRAIAVAMDVADEASTIAAYDAAEAAFGTVDTIIANAGMNSEGMTTDLPVEEFDRVMAVNLRGPFLTAREGARRLMAAGSAEKQHGRIVITSSVTAHKVDAGLAVYSGSKAGVLQMGKVMARDWVRKGINVNMICPGYIKTAINGAWFDTPAGERQIQKFPRRRMMEESDLDAILLFLASDASRAVTGTHITIDDGQSL